MSGHRFSRSSDFDAEWPLDQEPAIRSEQVIAAELHQAQAEPEGMAAAKEVDAPHPGALSMPMPTSAPVDADRPLRAQDVMNAATVAKKWVAVREVARDPGHLQEVWRDGYPGALIEPAGDAERAALMDQISPDHQPRRDAVPSGYAGAPIVAAGAPERVAKESAQEAFIIGETAKRAGRTAARGRWAARHAQAASAPPATIGAAALAVDLAAESEAVQAGKARRLALQARTTPAHRDRERGHWDQAIADHEPGPRAILSGTWEVVSGSAAGRAQWVSLYPDREEMTAETTGQLARRLAAARSSSIKPQHAVAHFVVSWRDDPTLAEAVATARRLCARLGIDPEQQQVGAAMHHDGKSPHLHLLVARTRHDGGVWTAGLGVDRALALESRLMALENGAAWDQRMIAHSTRSGAALGMMRTGKLAGTIRYDGVCVAVPWQGAAVSERIEADVWSRTRTGGDCLAKMVGLRSAHGTARYVLSA